MSTGRSLMADMPGYSPSIGIIAALRTALVFTTIFGVALAASAVEPANVPGKAPFTRVGAVPVPVTANHEAAQPSRMSGARIAGRVSGGADAALLESASLVLLGIGLLGTARLLRCLVAKRTEDGNMTRAGRPGLAIGRETLPDSMALPL